MADDRRSPPKSLSRKSDKFTIHYLTLANGKLKLNHFTGCRNEIKNMKIASHDDVATYFSNNSKEGSEILEKFLKDKPDLIIDIYNTSKASINLIEALSDYLDRETTLSIITRLIKNKLIDLNLFDNIEMHYFLKYDLGGDATVSNGLLKLGLDPRLFYIKSSKASLETDGSDNLAIILDTLSEIDPQNLESLFSNESVMANNFSNVISDLIEYDEKIEDHPFVIASLDYNRDLYIKNTGHEFPLFFDITQTFLEAGNLDFLYNEIYGTLLVSLHYELDIEDLLSPAMQSRGRDFYNEALTLFNKRIKKLERSTIKPAK